MKFHVREIRNRNDISIRDLARKAGVTASYLQLIEKGEANPSIEVMCRIARALSVPIVELFDCD